LQQIGINLGSSEPLSIVTLLINLAIGLGLAVLLRWHFERFGSTLSNRSEFAGVFPFILLTTILIITVVKSSLALSLGLVGALSIVRFRTPIKEPEELAYLFIAIARGRGLGADQTVPTVVAGLTIMGIGAGLRLAHKGQDRQNLYLSLDWSPQSEGHQPIQAVEEVVTRHISSGELRRIDRRNGTVEATYFIDVSNTHAISSLVEDLQSTFPGIGVTFIDQNRLPNA
jgi:hypothetical protein